MTALHDMLGVSPQPSVEAYARKHGTVHPDVVVTLREFFPRMPWSNVRILVQPRDWRPFALSGRGSPTPMFVVFNTIYVTEGFLGAAGRLWGNKTCLWNETGEGWETLVHELKHVEQYLLDGGWRMILRYIGGVFRSLVYSGGSRSWYHKSIPFEQEAIGFARVVRGSIVGRADPRFWAKWKEIG
jgi:hypothetical protein